MSVHVYVSVNDSQLVTMRFHILYRYRGLLRFKVQYDSLDKTQNDVEISR